MIVYDRFWQTLKQKGISTYVLDKKYHVPSSTLQRLRANRPLTTTTLNDLCVILNCELEDIAQYVPNDTDQLL